MFRSKYSFLQKYVSFKLSCRSAAFKVLKSELKFEDTDLKIEKDKSTIIRNTLEHLFVFAKSGGGSKSIYRHKIINKKLLVRQRLKLLFDSDSPLLEIGLLAGMCMNYGTIPAASLVSAIGKIHGQYCIVCANDATVKGGTFFPITVIKQFKIHQLSYMNYLPCIYLVDSGGAYLPLQADIFPDRNHGGRSFYNEAVLSALGISQIALVCGSCTAGGAYCPTMAEEAIIVKGTGTIYLGGPPLVKAATGEEVTDQDLGGADVHCRISGCTDYYAENEEEALEMCRESVLSLNMPDIHTNILYKEPIYSPKDLFLLSGKSVLSKEDMYVILSRILDGSMFKEFKQKFGFYLTTGFGYIQGMIVGVLANYGSLTFQDAQKGTHFIQLCEKRNIPLIFLQNSGNLAETILEDSMSYNVLKDRAKMISAHACCEVAKITVNVGGCVSDDNYTMCGFALKPNFFFSWPLAHISSSRTVAQEAQKKEWEILYKLGTSQDIDDYDVLFEDYTSAFYHASAMMSDGIIYPEDTRKVLAVCLEVSKRKSYLVQDFKKNLNAMFRM